MKFDNLILVYHLPWGNKATEIVKRWFRNNFSAGRNLVIDHDFERRFPTLKEIHTEYPNINTCTVVINPYSRALIQYNWAIANKEKIQSFIKIDNFENFLISILENKQNSAVALGSSQTEITTYKLNNISYTTNIILRSEFIEKDFYKLQDFVKSKVPIVIRGNENKYPYRKQYNKNTKELVSKIFKNDLETFNYSF